MKICIPITNLTIEGNVVFDLSKELAKKGHKITLVVPHEKGLPLNETFRGVEIKRFRYFWPYSLESLAYGSGILKNIQKNPLKALLLPFFLLSFSLKIALEARKCNIVHSHWLPSAIACLPAKLLFKKPVILTVHGTDVRGIPKPLVWLAAKTTNAITTSHESLVETIEKAGGKAQIIRNMIDFEAFENPKDLDNLKREFDFWKKPTVVSVGRFIELRDPNTFVKAAKLVPEANFVMVGAGKLYEKTRKFAFEQEAKNVFFTGRRKEVAGFLKLSNVFVSTATFDNIFSSTIVESAISGTPMILTKVGKTSQYFNSENSILFKVGDYRALAKSVKELLNNPAKAKKLAENAKATVKKAGFDKELIVKQNEQLYKRLAP